MSLYRKLNTIEFNNLTHPKNVSEFIKAIYYGKRAGFEEFDLGFFGFNNLIKLKNMNGLIQSIVQRSVSQRMAESIE